MAGHNDTWPGFNPGWRQQYRETSLLFLTHCLFGYVCESRLVSVDGEFLSSDLGIIGNENPCFPGIH